MSEWIEHDGGPCPVGDDVVIVRQYRDGLTGNPLSQKDCGGDVLWRHEGFDAAGEIVAYRVVKP